MDPSVYISYLSKRETLLIIGFLLLMLGGYAVYSGFYLAYILMVISAIIVGHTFGRGKTNHEELSAE